MSQKLVAMAKNPMSPLALPSVTVIFSQTDVTACNKCFDQFIVYILAYETTQYYFEKVYIRTTF